MNDELVKIIITVIGLIIMAIGVILIFDARNLTKKWFSFGDRNDGVKTLKIIGFVIAIIGGIIIIVI